MRRRSSTAGGSPRQGLNSRSSRRRPARTTAGTPSGCVFWRASSRVRRSRSRAETAVSSTTPRAVLVTGGGRGIGRAIALRFAETGAQVFVKFFVNREAAEKTARDGELRGGRAHLLQADLKEPT